MDGIRYIMQCKFQTIASRKRILLCRIVTAGLARVCMTVIIVMEFFFIFFSRGFFRLPACNNYNYDNERERERSIYFDYYLTICTEHFSFFYFWGGL